MIKRREEVDEKKRTSLAHDWQKLMAKYMPYIPYSMPGGAGTFSFAWPWFGNYGVHQTYGTFTQPSDMYVYYWYDKSKDTRSS
jgi:ABC-type transport system substrate-binding protein